jgi:2,3-dihydroxybenzoate decarboxylase
MRYVALEEHFAIPELTAQWPSTWNEIAFSRSFVADVERRLPDYTEYRLADMDPAGIDIQVLSLTVPGVQADTDPTAARDHARLANDHLARVVAGHPDRFRGFAALPTQDPKAVVEELDRAVRELGFRGALVNDAFRGHYLDEPRYDELWTALEELSVPLYLHPGIPSADHWKLLAGRPELKGAMWSWAAEVGGHTMRLIVGGVFDRHPGAMLIIGHMGEFLPYMRSRLDSRYRTLSHDPELRQLPSAYLPGSAPRGNLPVYLYYHGGANVVSSGSFWLERGANLAREAGMIVIRPNYRLGALGWVHFGLLAGGDLPEAVNLGVQDQFAALRWVHENIAAGATAVSHLLTNPDAHPYFRRAVAQSLHPFNTWCTQQPPEAIAVARIYLDLLRIIDPAELQSVDPGRLLAVQNLLTRYFHPDRNLAWRPLGAVTDGNWVPRAPALHLSENTVDNPAGIFGVASSSANANSPVKTAVPTQASTMARGPA